MNIFVENIIKMIRKAEKKDLPQVLSIITIVKQKMLEKGNPQWNSSYPGEQEYTKDIEKGELFLEESEGNILGFMTINDQFPVEYEGPEWKTSLPALTIHRLAVNPEFRNKGIANRMFEFAEEYAKQQGAKSIRLDTFSKNEAAQKLFLANGYQFVGEIFMKGKETPYRCFEKEI